jgi:hypothetical protein
MKDEMKAAPFSPFTLSSLRSTRGARKIRGKPRPAADDPRLS